MSERIYLITYVHGNERVVSHGVGEDTLKNYILPPEPLRNFCPKYDKSNEPYIEEYDG